MPGWLRVCSLRHTVPRLAVAKRTRAGCNADVRRRLALTHTQTLSHRYVTTALQYMSQVGLVPQSDYSYTAARGTCRTNVLGAAPNASRVRASGHTGTPGCLRLARDA